MIFLMRLAMKARSGQNGENENVVDLFYHMGPADPKE